MSCRTQTTDGVQFISQLVLREKAGHVSRTIPPAVRRAVLVRDDGKCQVPGCRNHRYLDLHHIEHRQHGGEVAGTAVVGDQQR